MHTLTLDTAKYLVFIICLIAFGYWLTLPKRQKINLIVFGFFAALTALILAKAGAALYYDPRPFVTHHVTPIYPHGPDNGFPSDHTLLGSFVAVSIYYLNKKLGLALFVLAALVGVSRVAGHIHSPIDIIGSMVFAVVGGLVAAYLTPKVVSRFFAGSEHGASVR
jgi:undecaprenyl-diphosphatase